MTRTTSLARRRFELMAAEYVARIGARIKQRRDELDLTQEEVARRLPGNVTGQRVSLWERGEHQPRADSLEALAKALDVPVSYFLAAQADKTETPDLVGTMNGGGRSQTEQLDRIETLLEQNQQIILALAQHAGLIPETTHPERSWAAFARLREELAARAEQASPPARRQRKSSTG